MIPPKFLAIKKHEKHKRWASERQCGRAIVGPRMTAKGGTELDARDQGVVELLRRAGRIAALTGAGISTAAGIPDFRGPSGLYVTRQYDPEKTFDIGYFDRDPTYFFAFARDFVQLIERVKPTLTHRFLAALEAQGKLEAVITQNIDGLHQKAGSRRVLEVHGSVRSGHCRHCDKAYGYDALRVKVLGDAIARCEACGGVVKPDIVFFGEAVRDMEEASRAAARADLFLVIGSSLTVYPAALLPQYAGGQVVVVNQGPVEMAAADWLRVDEAADPFFARVAPALKLPRLSQSEPGGIEP
jgi:NAD-dependent deacetylase